MSKAENHTSLDLEKKYWATADKLRGHMDAAEYKHVVLGLIFLKYISDAFQAKYEQLEADRETKYSDPEDRDEYKAENIFWVPLKACQKGDLIDRTHRELAAEEIDEIARTYHAWRGRQGTGKYEDVPGFCRSVSSAEIREQGYVLTPGRYTGTAEVSDNGIPFAEKMTELTAALHEQFAEAVQLEVTIRKNLQILGFAEKTNE